MKNRYGVTPWGSWFIDVLESYQMGARLDRGRTYANTGRVLSLEFKNGTATAKVEGNYRPFNKVEITFPPLKEKFEIDTTTPANRSLPAAINRWLSVLHIQFDAFKFEEKIDAMIASKKELADMTVASGESWITRMSHEELRQLFDREEATA